MAVTAFLYGKALLAAFNGEVNWNSDVIKAMLLTSSYTPDRTLHDYVDDIRAYEVSGTGYTAGGATLTGCTATYVPADSATAWQASTAYAVGDIVRPAVANTHCYRCVVAGTSGASAPTWPTVHGQDVTDGTVTWEEYGAGYVMLDANDPTWANSTITARFAVFYVSTGVDATSPLIGYLDFGEDISSHNAEFKLTLPALGISQIAAA